MADPGQEIREARERAADEAAQDRPRVGASAPPAGTVAPGYVRAVHPEHGEPVVFVPGEMLPAWAAEALEAGRTQTGDDGVTTLRPRPARRAPSGKGERP